MRLVVCRGDIGAFRSISIEGHVLEVAALPELYSRNMSQRPSGGTPVEVLVVGVSKKTLTSFPPGSAISQMAQGPLEIAEKKRRFPSG